MEIELNALETKIRQMAQLCQNLRADNQKQRQQVAALGGNNKVLSERMIYARTRMESLLQKIPEGDET